MVTRWQIQRQKVGWEKQPGSAGWQGLDIAEIVPLEQIARAHELVEHPPKSGRVIVSIGQSSGAYSGAERA